ncbi:MAG: thiolase family protein [Acidimicrobiia bacterium]
MSRRVVIVDAVRSPLGRRDGALASVHPVDLAATVVKGLLGRAGVAPRVDEVMLGSASPVGEQGLNVARHVALAAGLPHEVGGLTIDAQCGAGLRAVLAAVDAVAAGTHDVVVAGGVEHMTRVPFGTALLLGGDPLGPRLLERYPAPVPQGVAAERAAAAAGLGREALDGWAARSHRRAADVRARAGATDEMVAVAGITADEPPVAGPVDAEALAAFPPEWDADGVVTAGNRAGAADGAAAVLVVAAEVAAAHGFPVLAEVSGTATAGGDPYEFGAAALPATRSALARAGLDLAAVDRFEVGEQFAVATLAWVQACGADPERVNVRGGAIGLGHPLGATGARMVVTLLHELAASGSRYGLATLAGADGVGAALVVTRG